MARGRGSAPDTGTRRHPEKRAGDWVGACTSSHSFYFLLVRESPLGLHGPPEEELLLFSPHTRMFFTT